MRILLVEDNAILSLSSQQAINNAGVYRIAHCTSLAELTLGPSSGTSKFDIAIIKKTENLLSDLEQVKCLGSRCGAPKVILLGKYLYQEEKTLKEMASLLKLPLLETLGLPLSSGKLKALLAK